MYYPFHSVPASTAQLGTLGSPRVRQSLLNCWQHVYKSSMQTCPKPDDIWAPFDTMQSILNGYFARSLDWYIWNSWRLLGHERLSALNVSGAWMLKIIPHFCCFCVTRKTTAVAATTATLSSTTPATTTLKNWCDKSKRPKLENNGIRYVFGHEICFIVNGFLCNSMKQVAACFKMTG